MGSIMPIVVGCPSCSSQLRVADDLLGRKVRCPACQTVFEASAVAEPAPQRQPAASESSRSEGRERANSADPAVPPAPNLGAIRLTLDDDEPPRPADRSDRVARPDPNAPRGRAVPVSEEEEPPKTS